MRKETVLLTVLLGACAGEEPPRNDAPAREGLVQQTIVDAANRFDADRAWEDLVSQVAFGPRVPGTPEHRACADWLAERLVAAGGTVTRDRFRYTVGRGTVWELENLLGRFGPEGGGRLLLLAHWDTRPWADKDPDPAKRNLPIPGANDGASGVAVLLEASRHLAEVGLPRGVDLLFVDGEDLGTEDDPEGYCRGSRRFASLGLGDYSAAIVLDMVGDAGLRIPVEPYSVAGAPELVDRVWSRAERLGVRAFSRDLGPPVFDDHVPLLEAGLPAIDLIDFDYPPWHTLADDATAVDRRSLEAVGRVVLSLALVP